MAEDAEGTKLVCPHCGSETLYSDEVASLLYTVNMLRVGGGVMPEYTGDETIVQDEGAVYVGNLWCRRCSPTRQLTEDELVTEEEFQAGRD